MIRCNRYTELMMRFFDRDLGEEEISSLDNHVRNCDRCKKRFDRLAGIIGALENAAPAEASQELDLSVLRIIHTLPAYTPESIQRPANFVPLHASASLLIVLAAALVLQGTGIREAAYAAGDAINLFLGGIWKMQIVYGLIQGLFPGLRETAAGLLRNIFATGAALAMLVGLRSVITLHNKTR